MEIRNYRAVQINDSENNNVNYRIIMLNNKNTIKEFQQSINDIKNEYIKNGNFDWMIEDILSDKRLEKFDWFEIYNDDDYLVI